jgi:redox-sensitive bicupin YhaK (pirin superfamily)
MSATEIRRSVEVREGDGVAARRLMPASDWMSYDPFVLWENFSMSPGAALPARSQRGFEAVTYLLSGALRHEDASGNRSTVIAGGAQRFTAGRGLTYSETPVGDAGARGIRLWIDLPKRLKQIEPDYQQADADAFPAKEFDGGRIVTLAGEGSPLRLHTPVRLFDIHLDPGCTWRGVLPEGFRGLVYVAAGSAAVLGRDVDGGEACFLENPKQIRIEAREEVRLLACFGQPHGEPIASQGALVD